MKERLAFFLKNNCLLLLLILYGVFLIFYKWSGSLMGDESTYAQIAKEMLADRSFLIPHWKQTLWFEKPPLILWLTALSFKIFGTSETAAHIFPGIFGILSATTLYFTGLELFKSKKAGFFAGYVFLTTPIILLYDRALMMDIPVGFFISLSFLAILKIKNDKNSSWWLVFFISMAFGVLTKSIVGLFPLIFLPILVFSKTRFDILRNKKTIAGLLLFIIIVAPWHMYMHLNFGSNFWNDYLGFHVWKRINVQIFQYPWENGSNFGYIKLLVLRTNLWFWLFLVLATTIIINSFLWKSAASKNIRFLTTDFLSWLNNNRNNLLVLLFWTFSALIPFFISSTKLPNYMVLSLFPISILVGGFLVFLFKKSQNTLFLSLLSLINLFPIFRLHASDFGEAHFFLPKIFIRFLNLDSFALEVIAIILAITLILLYIKENDAKNLFKKISLTIFIAATMIIPFNPLRNEFIKKLGLDISNLSHSKPVKLYYKIKPDQYSFNCVGAYYLPIHSSIVALETRGSVPLSEKQPDEAIFCFTEKTFANKNIIDNSILSYEEGFLTDCSFAK